jgi:hypothetical protein
MKGEGSQVTHVVMGHNTVKTSQPRCLRGGGREIKHNGEDIGLKARFLSLQIGHMAQCQQSLEFVDEKE